MVSLFNQFKGAKKSFKSNSKRCKIQSIEKFNPEEHWSVDRWWSKEEKVDLGIEEEDTVFTIEEFKEKISDAVNIMKELSKEVNNLK